MASISNYFENIFKSNAATDETMTEICGAKLKPDPDYGAPNKAWKKRLKHCQCMTVTPIDSSAPVDMDHVRFVCISDTHTKLEQLKCLEIPDGDVLLHAGDFTMLGQPDEVDVVNQYLSSLPHKHKVIIAGNHDISFDLDLVEVKRSTRIWKLTEDNYESRLKHFGVKTAPEMLRDCIYLQDSMTEIHGIKIYGSPWTVGGGHWAFQRTRGQGILKKWNQIPADTDILLTHSPPCGYGDNVKCISSKLKQLVGGKGNSADHVGCVDLLNTVQRRVKPKYHVFGHIHEGYGVYTDGITTFVNASTCTESYRPINLPIVFDIPVPEGHCKTEEERKLKRNTVCCCNSKHCDKTTCSCDSESDLSQISGTESAHEITDKLKSSPNKEIDRISPNDLMVADSNTDSDDSEFNIEIDFPGFLESVQDVSKSGRKSAHDDDDDGEIDIVFDTELS